MGTPTCDYSIYRTSWSQLLLGAIPFLVTVIKIGCHDNTPWPYYSPKVELSLLFCFVPFADVAEQLGDKASPLQSSLGTRPPPSVQFSFVTLCVSNPSAGSYPYGRSTWTDFLQSLRLVRKRQAHWFTLVHRFTFHPLNIPIITCNTIHLSSVVL